MQVASSNPVVLSFASERELFFDEVLTADPDFNFYIDAFIIAVQFQLERIEELYCYDELEMGHILENLVEGPTKVSLEEGIIILKHLSKFMFYKEESCCLSKICNGHTNEQIAHDIAETAIDSRENQLQAEWENDPKIQSFTFSRVKSPTLITFWKKTFDLYANYTHTDDCQDCSYPYFKKFKVEKLSFQPILSQFEEKIENSELNKDREWGVLLKKIFGINLLLVME